MPRSLSGAAEYPKRVIGELGQPGNHGSLDQTDGRPDSSAAPHRERCHASMAGDGMAVHALRHGVCGMSDRRAAHRRRRGTGVSGSTADLPLRAARCGRHQAEAAHGQERPHACWQTPKCFAYAAAQRSPTAFGLKCTNAIRETPVQPSAICSATLSRRKTFSKESRDDSRHNQLCHSDRSVIG